MVRRRLNRKVAFLGSAFFIIVALGSILVLLQFRRDAGEFIKDAENAILIARQTDDQKIKEENYDIARRKYSSAYSRAKTSDERKAILFDMVNLFIETRDWPYVLDCWDKILVIEPDNVKAQYGRLRYFEILGQSGIPNAWKRIYDYAVEFLKTAQQANLLNEDLTNLQIPALEQGPTETKHLGAYLYLAKGEGAFEQANRGSVTNVEEMLDEAHADFEKVRELEPNNIDVYLNLAKTVIAKGELAASKGSVDERKKSREQALKMLEQGLSSSTNTLKANVNLINFKLLLARESDPEKIEAQLKVLEPEFVSLQNKFSSNAEVFESVSQFYSVYSQYTKRESSRQNLDKALDAALNALKLDEHNAEYAIQVTDLYHRRFYLAKNESDLDKAVEIAKNALTWPDTQNSLGPRNNIRIRNKFLLNSFLADSYIGQILEPAAEISKSDKDKLLNEAQQSVHEIETILGTSEDPMVIKWQGMLDLAKGNRQKAVVELNKSYEQMKAVKPAQPPWPLDLEFAKLSYTLAKLFMNTDELGKVHEFLVNAHYSGITEIKPEARLDYVEVVLQFNRFSDALQNIDAFEEDYGPTPRSRQLRAETNIYSNKFDEAEKELDKLDANDADTLRLRLALTEARIRQIQMSLAQNAVQNDVNSASSGANQQVTSNAASEQQAKEDIKIYTQFSISLLEKLLKSKPEYVEQSSVINICRNCITNDEIQQAQDIVKAYLAQFPDDIAINIYKQILSEPDPAKISIQRYSEIQQQALSNISDPVKRAANLGVFYRKNGDDQKAIEQLNIALKAANTIEPNHESPELDNVKLAASHMFEIALSTGNWDIADKVLKIVRNKNLDGFKGLYFDARLTAAKKDLKGALAKVDECIKQQPVVSQLYVLRSSIDSALGDEYAYMEDISRAAYMNPLDGTIAKRLAMALYDRNQNLGSQVTQTQASEARNALEKAYALNQGDMELLGLYTEYIAPTEPERAIAIRQNILAASPSVDNAMMLGALAMNVAENAKDPNDKEGFFDIAGSAFEQARNIDPNNRMVFLYYTRYLQARGRNGQVQELLEASQDNVLVANNLYQQGDYESAKLILEKLYNSGTRDPNVLRGLMLITQKLNDREGVKKYSEELISADNNINNLISQIRVFLTVGLTADAQYKLQSLKEKYPDEPSVKLLQAWLFLRQDNTKKALETVNNYIQNNKNNPAAWQLRSEINIAMGQYDTAISDLKMSKSLSDDPSIAVLLAKAYIQVNKFDEAENELKDVISKPNPPVDARLMLENIYLQLNRKTALENLYDDILEKYPDNVQWLNKAAAYALASENYGRAEKYFKKACDVIRDFYSGDKQGNEINDGTFVTVFDGYLEALLNETGHSGEKDNWHPEKSQTLIKEAQKYIDSNYASLAYERMAEASIRLQEDDKVSEYCRLSLDKINPNGKYASEVLLRLYPILGLDEIMKFGSQMLEKNPDSIAANYALYYLLRVNNDYDKSIDYISKCIQLAGDEAPIKNDYIMKRAETLLFAYSYTSDNKYINMAINDYESLKSEMPNNIKVLNNLAYVLAESNQKVSDALEYSMRVQKMKPNDPDFLDTYAYVLLKNGKDTEAEKTIDEAIRQYTEQGHTEIPGEVYEHKGMIKEKLDKKEEAYTAYERAMKLGSQYFTQKTIDRINQAIERVSP